MNVQYNDPNLSSSFGVGGSFPKSFGYGVEDPDPDLETCSSASKPRILLMGLRRSGKSSIQKVRRFCCTEPTVLMLHVFLLNNETSC